MGYLTYLGASAGSPTDDRAPRRSRARAVRGRASRWSPQSGCLACHKIGENGNDGPGPDLDRHRRARCPRRRSRARSINPTAPMPSFATCRRRSCNALVDFLAQLQAARRLTPPWRLRAGPHGHPRGGPGAGDVRPHRRRLRRHELGHDRRPAPPLARARRRPGRASGRATACSTWPPAPATWRSSWLAASRRRRGRRHRTSPRRCSSARAREGARRLRWEWGDALALPYADGEFDAATVGFGARNFSDLDRGLAEMARVVRPGRPGRRPRDHHAARKPPLSTFFSVWFDRVVPLLGRLAGDPDAYSYLPTRSSASPARRRWRRRWTARGPARRPLGPHRRRDHRPPRRGRSGRWRAPRRSHAAGRGGRRRTCPRLDGRASRSGLRGAGAPATATVLAEHAGRDDRRRRQAAAPAARVPRRRAARRATREGLAARRRRGRARPLGDARPRRRARRRGAAPRAADGGRRRRAARWRPRPATCCSRARSPSWRRNGRAGRGARAVGGVARRWRGRAAAARGRVGRRRPARALPAPLRAEDRAAVRGRLRAGRARGRRRRPDALGALRPPHRAGLPAARRRARRLRARPSGPASTAAPTCSTARSRCRSSSRASATRSWRRSTCARSRRPSRPRRCATRSRRPARWTRRARGRWRSSPRRRPTCRRCRSASARALELVADGVVGPATPTAARSPSGRMSSAVERGDEALDLVLHVGPHEALEVADERLGAAVELLVEALDASWSKTPVAPLAVGAAQGDLPVRRRGLLPLDRVDQVASRTRGRRAGPRRRSGGVGAGGARRPAGSRSTRPRWSCRRAGRRGGRSGCCRGWLMVRGLVGSAPFIGRPRQDLSPRRRSDGSQRSAARIPAQALRRMTIACIAESARSSSSSSW